MSETYSPYTNHSDAETPAIGEKISDATKQAGNKLADIGHEAETKFDQNRTAAASGLQDAAESLHRQADHLPGVDSVSEMAHGAADKLSATANYFRNHDLKRMMRDVEAVVKSNPGPSMLAAVVVGVVVGRAFRGRD